MYGAILGDIISFRHKRDESGRCYLVEPKIKFTVYTVSMIALADVLISADSDDINQLEEKIRHSLLIRWGKEYFNVNYDAVTRASIIPYIYNDRECIEEVAELTSVVTSYDLDDFYYATLAPIAVYYGMRSSGKNSTRNNFESEIGFEMFELIGHGNIVAEVMDAFLNSTNVRNFLKVPDSEEDLTDELIENAIRQFNKHGSDENRKRLMKQIYYGMRASGNLRIPLVVPDKQKVFDEGKLTDDIEYLTHQTADGKTYVVAYTSDSTELSEKYSDIYLGTIEDVFNEMLGDEVEESGIILNPDDKDLTFTLGKDVIKDILNRTPPENKMFFFDGSIGELNTDAIVSSDCEDFKYLSFKNADDVVAAHFMTKNPRHIIYTPLMFYDGDDENVILNCYYSCLKLTKKHHLASVAFPRCFISPFLNKAIKRWFDANEDCGMTVIVASDDAD